MPKKAIIFDLDGTLINTEKLAEETWRRTLAQFGLTLTDDVLRKTIGERLDIILDFMVDHYNLPLTPKELGDLEYPIWKELNAGGAPAMPGADALLATLDERGVPWAVATNSDTQTAINAITHLGFIETAGAIFGSDRVENPKPAPDMYVAVAQAIGFEPSDCLGIEDSVLGHKAAHDAGMTTIVIPNEWQSPNDYPLADYIFTSLNGVQANLDTLLNG